MQGFLLYIIVAIVIYYFCVFLRFLRFLSKNFVLYVLSVGKDLQMKQR